MRSNKPIQVFEHELLLIKKGGFEDKHWNALGDYNELHGGKFFQLTPNGVRFKQYVGVIQVGNITIEVLPKIGRTTDNKDKDKWQRVLIDMLRECRWMSIHTKEKAALRFKPNSILEAYLELFIQECEEIRRKGFVKKYRWKDNNCTALKGKLLFHKQLQVNLIHKERFFNRQQSFDHENLYNQILLKALKLIPVISKSPFLRDRVYSLLLSFPELADISVNQETFENIVYDRRTARYKEAMEIAAMLLLNYRPDISSGRNHILAILFDMNELWEEYIYRQLAKPINKPHGWTVRPQNSKSFWKLNTSNRFKTIRPDIIVEDGSKTVVLDTKWKIPDKNIPDDSDLKQMFVYNEYWNSQNTILLYPNATFTEEPIFIEGAFAKKPIKVNDSTNAEELKPMHKCGVMKMAVLDKNNSILDISIGKRINNYMKREILV